MKTVPEGGAGRNTCMWRQYLEMVKEEEDGGSNFFQHIRGGVIRQEAIVAHRLRRGESSFHDSYIPHSSPPNLSPDRRCAWIVRCHQHNIFLISISSDMFREAPS